LLRVVERDDPLEKYTDDVEKVVIIVVESFPKSQKKVV
jgi:hypothetical protein